MFFCLGRTKKKADASSILLLLHHPMRRTSPPTSNILLHKSSPRRITYQCRYIADSVENPLEEREDSNTSTVIAIGVWSSLDAQDMKGSCRKETGGVSETSLTRPEHLAESTHRDTGLFCPCKVSDAFISHSGPSSNSHKVLNSHKLHSL